jgi:hypothetical protein
MTQREIFATALGIQSPWFVESIVLDPLIEELNIKVNFARGSLFKYIDDPTEYSRYTLTETKTYTYISPAQIYKMIIKTNMKHFANQSEMEITH